MTYLLPCSASALSSGIPLNNWQSSREEVLARFAAISSDKEPPLVLLVEDDRSTRTLLRELMEQEGYRVAEAEDGEAGIEAYVRLSPNIVLLDAIMPIMDGFACCSQLQKLPGSAQTPVLMITALEDAESVDRAFDVGATDYVTKPIHWPVLRQRVKRLIQQSQLCEKLEAAIQELQSLACRDGLTQLANRRLFDETLECEWWRMMCQSAPLSMIMCDVDFFKLYNDTFGHQAGDSCLKRVAMALKSALKRSGDFVARYGGEEFAVILPNTDAACAVRIAYQIRLRIRDLQIPHPKSKVSQYVTLSLGAATIVPSPETAPENLIAGADTALYWAKHQGRNLCCTQTL
ncbi:MAG: PleD family two-component system response regulator [Oscillatoria sp. SIO1A7]|nr:PleD family two-component system response regulator [Oscillatoria sp. SIO1A7]